MKPVQLSWFDRLATALSPQWGAGRVQNKLKIAAYSGAGFVVPGSPRKSMKGVVASANSPDRDIIDKLDGMRALSRDLSMNSDLAVAILRRHRVLSVGPGLQVQSNVDRDFLGLSTEEAEMFEKQIEREFDLWAESFCSDFDGINFFGDNQGLGYLNMLSSGDFFFMPVWREPPEAGFPYRLTVKLIDADLVRTPIGFTVGNRDVKGGVEKDASGRIVAVYVWNTYPNEVTSIQPSYVRVPIFDARGRQQIYHVFDPERINQRRGVPLLAPVADSLKQLTRLSEAELMSALVASYFTVFVKDASGLGTTFGPAMTPEEVVTGGGRYGPNEPEVGPRRPEDGNDLEMGIGNVTYLDDQKDISIADPGRADRNFDKFWDSLAATVAAGANIPIEQVLMRYQTSYTAAKAAANDVWKYRQTARSLMARRFCQPIFIEWISEAILRGRVSAPGFFEDYSYKRAWSRCYWVGLGQGHLDPLREAKASVTKLDANLTTHEAEFMAKDGGRWDNMIEARAREEQRLAALGLTGSAPTEEPVEPEETEELIGPEEQESEENEAIQST